MAMLNYYIVEAVSIAWRRYAYLSEILEPNTGKHTDTVRRTGNTGGTGGVTR